MHHFTAQTATNACLVVINMHLFYVCVRVTLVAFLRKALLNVITELPQTRN